MREEEHDVCLCEIFCIFLCRYTSIPATPVAASGINGPCQSCLVGPLEPDQDPAVAALTWPEEGS